MSIAFERAQKTFLGFLEARGKAANTIKNYVCDLRELETFCDSHGLDFQNLGLKDLENYHRYLVERALKPNSQRRKLMTAKTFLRYLSGRMDVSTVGSEKLITPEKVETPPKLVPRELIERIISAQPNTELGLRNRALIGVLLDTGMLVTEALSLQQADLSEQTNTIRIPGKRDRSVLLSGSTATALRELAQKLQSRRRNLSCFFYGYTKAGPNAERLTSRGVEVLFKGWARSQKAEHLHPRTLRHVFVIEKLFEGKSQADIMQTIGLRTPYAFRVYKLLFDQVKSTNAATYSADNDPARAASRP